MASTVRVFISHKHEDAQIALRLHRLMRLYGGDRVDCFISERIPYGAEWFEAIRENLAEADILVLIFTRSDRNWDWPLYEVGLATDLEESERCRIVCLHSPDSDPPEPIKYTQAVSATKENLEDFLYKFFCTDEIASVDEPINREFSDDRTELKEAAEELAEFFDTEAQPWEKYFTQDLRIMLDDSELESRSVPEDARIEPKSGALEMFRKTATPPGRDFWTWKDLDDAASRPEDEEWKSALGERIYHASQGDVLKSMDATFECLKTGRLFRPLLNKVQMRSNRSFLFEVIFVEHSPNGKG